MKCSSIAVKQIVLMLLVFSASARFLKKVKRNSGNSGESTDQAPFEFTNEMRQLFLELKPNYVLGKKPLGQGGYGIVFKLKRKGEDGDFAIKFILIGNPNDRTDSNRKKYEKRLNNFTNEMEITAELQMNSLFSVPTCESGSIQTDSNVIRYLVYPLANGDLYDEIEKRTVTDPKEKQTVTDREKNLKTAIQMALAVKDVTEFGIIHRDIKPDNFLRLNDDRVVLADFGLGIETEEAKKETLIKGTELYIPHDPNSANKKNPYNLTPQVDVFALGLTMAEYMIPEFWSCRKASSDCIMKDKYSLIVFNSFTNDTLFEKIHEFYNKLVEHRGKKGNTPLTPVEKFIFNRMVVPLKIYKFMGWSSIDRATINEVIKTLKSTPEFEQVTNKYKEVNYCKKPQGNVLV